MVDNQGFNVERRRFVRVASDLPVQLKRLPQDFPTSINNSLAQDISEGGLRISSFYFYPVNSKVTLEVFMRQGTEPVKAVGKVVWVEQLPYQERYRVGLEFSDINEDGRAHLKEVITNIQTPPSSS